MRCGFKRLHGNWQSVLGLRPRSERSKQPA